MKKDEIKKLKEYFKKRKDVLMAFVFGSFAKGWQMKESDFDIAVYFESKPTTFEKEDEIWSDANKIIKNKETHIVCLNEAPATLISDIFKTGIPLVIKDKNLYWDLYLQKSTEAEDFLYFARDFFRISESAKSLNPEEENKLLERLRFLKIELREIEYFKKITFEEYEKDKEKRRNIERWAENILNTTIDIAKIVLASEKKEMPKSYESALFNFAFLVGFDEEQSERFSKFANLRNILAHEYLDILYKRIQDFIQNFPLFYEKISNFLDKYLKT